MKLLFFEYLLIFLICISLIFMYLVSSFEYKKINDVSDCEGKIKIIFKINETFYSKKGNYFGRSNNFLVYLNKFPYVSKGDKIIVFGKGVLNNKTCFIFPDKLKILRFGETL